MEFSLLNPDFDRDTRASFDAQGMMHTLGATVVSVAPGHVVLEAPIRAETTQQDGFAHAGLGWTLGDSAAGYATFSCMAPGERVLTVEMKVNLMRPGVGQKLIAEGRLLRFGRNICTAKADIFAVDGVKRTHISTMLGTMARIAAV